MIQLTITLQDDGRLQVTGPIQDLMLCYGLLEATKDALRAQQAAPKPSIVPVRMELPRNGRDG